MISALVHRLGCLFILFVVLSILGRSVLIAQEQVLFQTDFAAMEVGPGKWMGQDGWSGENATNAQGVVQWPGTQDTAVYLGKVPPDRSDRPSYVWRAVEFDPALAGLPEIVLDLELRLEDSTNGAFDRFVIQFYNQANELLGGVELNNGDLFFYFHSQTERVNTGSRFANAASIRLQIVIDFSRNLWSAKVDGNLLFPFLRFADPGIELDLGDLAFGWIPSEPHYPGNNFLLINSLELRARTSLAVAAIGGDAAPGPLEWRSGGDAPWFWQNATKPSEAHAAQSGAIGDGELSWIETEVDGPGEISYSWRISSEHYFDWLRFYVGGVEQARTSGPQGWHRVTRQIPAGRQVLRWAYEKDGSESWGWDTAWLAEVSWVPESVGETYAGWLDQHGLSGNEGAPAFSAGGDGVSNAVKYLLGLGPLDRSEDLLPRLQLEQNEVGLALTRAQARNDAMVAVEISPDLKTWQPLPVREEVLSFSEETGQERVRLLGERPDWAQLFLRAKVTILGQ